MDIKKFLTAFVAGFVVMFIISFLWHNVIMASFYNDHMGSVMRSEPIFLRILAGSIVLTALMAYIYPKGYAGDSPLTQGIKFGIIVGLLWTLPHGLIFSGVLNITLTGVLGDAAWHIVEEGITGAVIGLVYGKISTTQES